jgi:hypothetical protein
MKFLLNVPEPSAARVRAFQRELNNQIRQDSPRRKPASYNYTKRYLAKSCAEYALKHWDNGDLYGHMECPEKGKLKI